MPQKQDNLDYRSLADEPRTLDPRKTLIRAVGVLCMLVIAVFGMCYAAWFIWTGAK